MAESSTEGRALILADCYRLAAENYEQASEVVEAIHRELSQQLLKALGQWNIDLITFTENVAFYLGLLPNDHAIDDQERLVIRKMREPAHDINRVLQAVISPSAPVSAKLRQTLNHLNDKVHISHFL